MVFELKGISDFLILLALGTIGLMTIVGLMAISALIYYDVYLPWRKRRAKK